MTTRRAERETAGPPRPTPPAARRPRLSRRGLLLLLVAVAVVVAGCLAVLYLSPWLRVRQVRVTGVRALGAGQVRAAAAVPEGTALASVDTDAVAGRVRSGLPGVAAVEVVRSWPHTLTLNVTERTPAAVLEKDGKYVELDADGVRFATESTAPSGVPRVELATGSGTRDGSAGRDASSSNGYFGPDRLLRAAVQVATDLPAPVRKRTRVIQVRSFDAVSLQLDGGRTVVWGSAERGAQKSVALRALLKAAGGARHFDVSVPSAPAASGS
nr:FtsQ-type POTRA domain-containing protein [Streptomyces sp. SID5468]